MDFNADLSLKQVILEVCNNSIPPTLPDWRMWKHITERMMRFMSVMQIHEMIDTIASNLSDEQWLEGYPKEIFGEPKKQKKVNKTYKKMGINLSILEVAEKYGIRVRSNKCVCPFHKDTDPSLVFYPETNSFFCFGACRKGGDVIEFIRKLEEIKNGNKTRSN